MHRKLYWLLAFLLVGCSAKVFKERWVKSTAPEHFTARFETTEGNFDIESYRKWSPLAVDRLYQLITHHYFTNVPVYRVEPDFVVQFGVMDSLSVSTWDKHAVPDEPVVKTNTKGSIAFARAGKETRTSQLYINLKDNHRLDTISYNGVTGFPGIADVTKGGDVAYKFFNYTKQVYAVPDSVKEVTKYYKNHFPKMGYIKKAYIIK